MTDPETTIRVRIEGRVQGVWYRAWTVKQAEKRSVSGWVRNRSDGSVEALFRGSECTVRDMVELCRKGPPAARVKRVSQVSAGDGDGDGDGDEADFVPGIFRQLPTL
tara:strand:+ start:540 stop:860 length:321 start_codon:yes stop_codon:yes gene_type:complete